VAGAAMLGELSRSGVGEPTDVDCVKSIDGLKEGCVSSNAKLLKELRPDEGAEALLALTKADAALGRMQEPTPWRTRPAWSMCCSTPGLGCGRRKMTAASKCGPLIIFRGARQQQMEVALSTDHRRKPGKRAA
jgi:hypothetical protein